MQQDMHPLPDFKKPSSSNTIRLRPSHILLGRRIRLTGKQPISVVSPDRDNRIRIFGTCFADQTCIHENMRGEYRAPAITAATE